MQTNVLFDCSTFISHRIQHSEFETFETILKYCINTTLPRTTKVLMRME